MFGWFRRNKAKDLRRRYEAKMKEALDLQRQGDIPAFALATAEADELYQALQAAQSAASS